MQTVSVIITSYNQKEYLLEALESVMGQSVHPHEILVADDCSTDGSADLIRLYADRHPGWIKAILHDQNIGISENRNAALRQATGEYIAVLDGDDRYLSDNIEKQLNALHTTPDRCCVYSNLYFITALGERFGVRDTVPQPQGDIRFPLAMGKMGLLRSMLAPRTLVKKVGFLDKRYPVHDGYIFTLQLSRHARFAYVADPLAEYRVHSNSVSKVLGARERLVYLEDVTLEVFRLTADLQSRDVQSIKAVWFYRLLLFHLRSHFKTGNKSHAVTYGLSNLYRNPKYLLYLGEYFKAKKEGYL